MANGDHWVGKEAEEVSGGRLWMKKTSGKQLDYSSGIAFSARL